MRLLQIAQLQNIGIAKFNFFLIGKILDQHAAGAAVADIEHEIDIDRLNGGIIGQRVDQLQARQRYSFRQKLEKGDIARGVFERLTVLGTQGASALRGLELGEQLVDPAIDPFLVAGVARAVLPRACVGYIRRDVAKEAGEHEFMLAERVLRARRDIGAVGPTLHKLGVERKDDNMRVALRIARFGGGNTQPRPVGWPRLKQLAAITIASGLHREIGDGRPFLEKRLKRLLFGDFIDLIGALGGKGRVEFGVVVVPVGT